MADQPTPPPLPNPVMPSAFDASVLSAAANAQSPAERFQMSAPHEPFAPQMPPPQPGQAFSPEQAAAFEAARSRDRGEVPRAPQQNQPQAQPAQQPNQPANQPDIEFKRKKNGREIAKERDWSTVNAQLEQLREENAQLRRGVVPQPQAQPGQQPEAPEQAPSTQADIYSHPDFKRIKEERDRFYEEVKHVRVEADPEFRAKFDTQREAALKIAKSVSGQAAEDISRILSISDPDLRAQQLAERIKDFSEGAKARIIAANTKLNQIDVEREIEVQTRKATWEQRQASLQKQEQQSFMARAQKLDQEFNDVAAKWKEEMPFNLKSYDAVIADARRIFTAESDARSLADAAMRAAILPNILKGWESAITEVDTLRERLARYEGAYPGSDTGVPYAPPAPTHSGSFNPIDPNEFTRFAGNLQAARQADMQGQAWR